MLKYNFVSKKSVQQVMFFHFELKFWELKATCLSNEVLPLPNRKIWTLLVRNLKQSKRKNKPKNEIRIYTDIYWNRHLHTHIHVHALCSSTFPRPRRHMLMYFKPKSFSDGVNLIGIHA